MQTLSTWLPNNIINNNNNNNKLIFSIIGGVSLSLLCSKLFLRNRRNDFTLENFGQEKWDYDQLKLLLEDESLPAMIVDLDKLDANIARIEQIAKRCNKKIRLATKSVRVPELIKYILNKSDVFEGVMCYDAKEAEFLARNRFLKTEKDGVIKNHDILMGYPIFQSSDVAALKRLSFEGNYKIACMVDSIDHLAPLVSEFPILSNENENIDNRLGIVIDIDPSHKIFGVHIGPHRSTIKSESEVQQMIDAINEHSNQLRFDGVMYYEAQIAGVADNSSNDSWLTRLIFKLMKRYSMNYIKNHRKRLYHFLSKFCSFSKKNISIGRVMNNNSNNNNDNIGGNNDNQLLHDDDGKPFIIFNAGGSGDLVSAANDVYNNEVTIGSTLLHSSLFSRYDEAINQPAFTFALQCTRVHNDYISCESGGFIASGTIHEDKAPSVFLPTNLVHYKNEGFGEGDPVFFVPAKAGEISERFNQYLLIRNGTIVNRVKTYRGYGKTFY